MSGGRGRDSPAPAVAITTRDSLVIQLGGGGQLRGRRIKAHDTFTLYVECIVP